MLLFLPKRLEPYAFGLLLSGMMSFIVSGISTALAAGVHAGFMLLWLKAWVPSWSIAFPSVLVVAPLVRRILLGIVRPG
jgi:fructose-specific phosphotransferase system IIC component